MSYAEREALSGLITSLIVIGLFLWQLSSQQAAGAFEGPDALQIWARSVLILIGWSIGIAIIVAMLSAILHNVITGEKSDDRRDERDRDIDRRALIWAWYLLSFGLMGVIVSLAFGDTAFNAMNMVLGLCVLSEAFKDATKLVLYRREAPDMARIENRIRRLRFDAGEMTQKDLADRVGVTRQTILSIENGKYFPTLELAFRIARAFGVALDEVFTFHDD